MHGHVSRCTRSQNLRLVVALALTSPLIGSASASDYVVGPVPESLRQEWKLSPVYAKCIVAKGFPILAKGNVSNYALLEAAYIVDQMLAARDDLRAALVRERIRLVVMAYDEFTTEVPEHSDLTPKGYWDKRARGLGATSHRPAVSCGEENLLGFAGDPYEGENILVHEFAHGIHEIALKAVDPTFDQRLQETYEQAMKEGLWKGTYSTTNRAEYWAEGVQSWFDCNRDGIGGHNHIATRERLAEYDPRLAKLLAEVFKDNKWRSIPPNRRINPGHLAGYEASKSPRFVWPADVLAASKAAEAKKSARRDSKQNTAAHPEKQQ